MSRVRWNTRLIQISLDYLEEMGMDLNQYLSLMKLYIYQEEKEILPINVHEEDIKFLTSNEYIVEKGEEVFLTVKGMNIFEANEDLFEEFFNLYPHRVPDGVGGYRALGTKSPDTTFGAKMRKKWHNITKGNAQVQKDMIKALRYELNYRKRSGSLAYMQGMEVWFNKATWEKYIDSANEEDDKPKREDKLL